MEKENEGLLVPLSEFDPQGERLHPDARGWEVMAANGVPVGRVHDLLIETTTATPHDFIVELSGGDSSLGSASYRVRIPAGQARVDAGGHRVHLDSLSWSEVALLPHYGEQAERPRGEDDTVVMDPNPVVPPLVSDEMRVTLFGEELKVHTRSAPSGEVVVGKRVMEERVREAVSVMREDVVVERRPLPPGMGFEPRTEGDVIYVPLVREELVIEKRLVAREELVIRKRQLTEEQVVEETVRREEPYVRRSGTEEGGRPE